MYILILKLYPTRPSQALDGLPFLPPPTPGKKQRFHSLETQLPWIFLSSLLWKQHSSWNMLTLYCSGMFYSGLFLTCITECVLRKIGQIGGGQGRCSVGTWAAGSQILGAPVAGAGTGIRSRSNEKLALNLLSWACASGFCLFINWYLFSMVLDKILPLKVGLSLLF